MIYSEAGSIKQPSVIQTFGGITALEHKLFQFDVLKSIKIDNYKFYNSLISSGGLLLTEL